LSDNKKELKVIIIEDKFEDIKELLNLTCKPEHFKNIKKFYAAIDLRIEDYDFFLVDLKFGEKQKQGEKILEELSQRKISIPIFVLSWTHTAEEVSKIVSKGLADWYIHKSQLYYLDSIWENYKRNVLRIPETLEKKLCDNNSKIDSKFLVDFITLARRHSGMLWYGMKEINLNEHAYYHSRNLWNMAFELSEIIYNNAPEKEKDKDKVSSYALSFALSIWLHDIGLKGSSITRKPWEVRKQHSILSAYLLENYFDDYIFSLKISDGNLKKKVKRFVQILSIYHLRKTPLSHRAVSFVGGPENISETCKIGTRYEFLPEIVNEIIDKDDILRRVDFIEKNHRKLIDENEGLYYVKDKNLQYYTAWLRWLDAADFNYNRIGWREEENIRMWMNYEELVSLSREHAQNYLPIVEGKYKRILEKLTKNERSEISTKGKESKVEEAFTSEIEAVYSLYDLVNNYRKTDDLVSRQIKFHLESPLHYKTHSLVKNLKIEVNWGNNKELNEIRFVYYIEYPKLNDMKNKIACYLYLFRECRKMLNYIKGDFEPVKDILSKIAGNDEKKLEEKIKIDFITSEKSNNSQDIKFSFKFKEIALEKEIKYEFDTQNEAKEFLGNLFRYIFDIDKDFESMKWKTYINNDSYIFDDNNLLYTHGWLIRKRIKKPVKKGQKKREKLKEYTVKIKPLLQDSFQSRIEESFKYKKNSLKINEDNFILKRFLKRYGVDNKADIYEGLKFGNNKKIELMTERKSVECKWKGHSFEISFDVTRIINLNDKKNKKKENNLIMVEIEAVEENNNDEGPINYMHEMVHKIEDKLNKKATLKTKLDWAYSQWKRNEDAHN